MQLLPRECCGLSAGVSACRGVLGWLALLFLTYWYVSTSGVEGNKGEKKNGTIVII